MTENALTGDAAERLAEARSVYARIFRALQDALTRFEAGEDTPGEARQRQELYRTYVKQLQSVFELEGSIEKYGTAATGSRRGLDLDAARAEIHRRLARYREQGND